MKDTVLQKIQKSWPKFTRRVWELLNQWDGCRGVLFLSKDKSGYELADYLARELTDCTIRYHGENRKEWEKEMACVSQKNFQNVLFNKTSGQSCIIITELEHKPEWMFGRLKGIFEHPARPCIVFATAQSKKGIPTYLDGFFFECKKSGRPRKKRAERKWPG
jgi:hypothetical protein